MSKSKAHAILEEVCAVLYRGICFNFPAEFIPEAGVGVTGICRDVHVPWQGSQTEPKLQGTLVVSFYGHYP